MKKKLTDDEIMIEIINQNHIKQLELDKKRAIERKKRSKKAKIKRYFDDLVLCVMTMAVTTGLLYLLAVIENMTF